MFALFLEPSAQPHNRSLLDKCVDFAVRNLQVSRPVMSHVELVVPCCRDADVPVNFASYINDMAKWRSNRACNEKYYLVSHANGWRALPIFAPQCARKVREACDACEGARYSLPMYITSAWGLRNLAWILPDQAQSEGHCATIAARAVRAATGSEVLSKPSAFYSPSSLFSELSENLRARPVVSESSELNQQSLMAVESLLRDSNESLRSLSDIDALTAFRVLTLKTASAEVLADETAQVLAQKQLALALLRWSVFREPNRVDIKAE